MINATLQAEAKALAEKRASFKSWYDSKKAADGTLDLTGEGIAEFHKRNDELNVAAKSYEEKLAVAKAAGENEDELKALNAPMGRLGMTEAEASVSLGRAFAESQAYKSMIACGEIRPVSVSMKDFDVKTLMTTATGYAPANNRTNVVALSPQRRPVIADLIPQDNTDLSVIKYMLETTFTNGAAPTLEGAAFGESALAFTQVNSLVQKISTTLPVTDEQLKYVPQVAALVDGRLVLMMKQTEEGQILNGNGTSPNIQGFLGATGVQTISYTTDTGANGTDTSVDVLFRAMQKIRTNAFAEPDGIVINPGNWTPIRLLKSSYGTYIYGDPSVAGPERVFGCPVVVTVAIAAGTALVGDFALYSHISRAGEIELSVGYINAQFASGQKTIRATEYLSLEIYRPSAFCTATALPAG